MIFNSFGIIGSEWCRYVPWGSLFFLKRKK